MPETPKESADKILSRAFMSDADYEQHARTVAAELLRLLALEEATEWSVKRLEWSVKRLVSVADGIVYPSSTILVANSREDALRVAELVRGPEYPGYIIEVRIQSRRPAGEWKEEENVDGSQ